MSNYIKTFDVINIKDERLCTLLDSDTLRVRNVVLKESMNEISTLTFSLPVSNPKWTYLSNENYVYIECADGTHGKFVIKKPTFTHEEDGKLYVTCECKHISVQLSEQIISIEETTPLAINDLLKVVLCYNEFDEPTLGGGWKIGTVSPAVDQVAKRGLEASEQSPFSILLTVMEKFDCMPVFNDDYTIDIIPVDDGTDHPTMDLRISKNLKSMEISYDTSEMVTRLYCYGGEDDSGNELDIMSVNPSGMAYIDNFDYYHKLGYAQEYIDEHLGLFVKTNIWRNDAYYDPQDLYNDGIKELAKIAVPIVDVNVTALDSASQFDRRYLPTVIGSCIRVVDEDINVDTYCNVISREIDFEQPHLLTFEVTNSITYHDTLSKLFTDVSTASSVVSSGGMISGSHIESVDVAQIKNLHLYYLTAEQIRAEFISTAKLEAEYLTAEYIQAHYLDAERIGATYATIGQLNAIKAQIEDLDVEHLMAELAEIEVLLANYGEFNKLIATDAEIEELKAGKITVTGKINATNAEIENIKATYLEVGNFNAYKATIEQLMATKASIEYLEANYLNADKIEADYAKITALDAVLADIETLNAELANVETLVATKASIEALNAAKADIETLNASIANINKAIINVAHIEDLNALKATIETLIADEVSILNATIETLNAKFVTVEDFNANNATINTVLAGKATIEELSATNAKLGTIEGQMANIDSIMSGNVGTGSLQTIHLTASNVVIDDAIIKSAMIKDLDVSKLTAGVISTDKFTIKSDNGGIQIVGSTQKFTDKNGKVRLQIGRDANNNFTFIVFGEDGTTAVYDQNGITQYAVPDGLIVDDMVADNANISGSKIERESLIDKINSDGSKTIKSGKIWVDETNQSLGASFNSMTESINNTIQSVEELDKTVQGIEIGGRNYIVLSKLVSNTNHNTTPIATGNVITSTWVARYDSNLFTLGVSDWVPKSGVVYTVSGYVKVNGEIPTTKYFTRAIDSSSPSPTASIYDPKTGYFAITGERRGQSQWIICAHTTREDYSTDVVTLEDLKCEEGNKATDWTPAPEDIDANIDNVNKKITTLQTDFVVEQGKISSLISETEILTETVTTVETVANQAKTTATSASTTATEAKNTASTAKTTADSAKTAADSANTLAGTANTNANTAKANASTAVTTANTAKSTADTAKSTADTAKTTATNAQNTANSKRRNFTSQPVPPYDVGDLWSQGSTGEQMVCKTARASGSYVAGDWEKASKYTDDTKANAVQVSLTTLTNRYNQTEQTVAGNTTTIGNISTTVNDLTGEVVAMDSRITKVQQTADGVSTTVSANKSKWDSASTDATSALDKIDNMAIGGRNYIVLGKLNSYTTYNTKPTVSGNIISSTWNSSNSGNLFTLNVNGFNIGHKVYTLSGYVKVNGEIPTTKYFVSHANTYGWEVTRNEYDPETGYFAITQTYPGNSNWVMHAQTTRKGGSSDVVTLEKLKFEEGNQPTDWTPAPEDVTSEITATKTIAEQTADKFTWLVKSGTNATNFTLTDRVATLTAENINLNGLVTFGGLSTDAQSKINTATSTANTAKSTADTAKSTATTANTNASTALTKANTAITDSSTAKSTANTAVSTANTAKSTADTAKTTADSAKTTATTAQTTATNAQTAANNAALLAQAMTKGKCLFTDVDFRSGTNSVNVYNNAGSTTSVKLTRIAKPADCPTTSTHCLELTSDGVSTSPGYGGFRQLYKARNGALIVQRFIAKLPIGYKFAQASNNMGTGYVDRFITSADGTGKYTEYIRLSTCGTSGTFSDGGYVYVTGGTKPTAAAPLKVYIALCTAYDITDATPLDAWVSETIIPDITTINGGYIRTKTIKTDHLDVNTIFSSGSAVMNIINAQEINANRITAGQIQSQYLSLYGMQVFSQASNVETFAIDNEGEVTIRGSMESYDYNHGISGWSVKKNGDAEFNDVTVRGSLITNDGGIVTSGGVGRNLLLNSGMDIDFDKWSNSGFTMVQEDGYTCAKVSGALTTTKSLGQSIINRIKKDTTTHYTISCWVKMKNYVAGTTNPFCYLYFSGNFDNNGTSGYLGSTTVSGSPSIYALSGQGWVYMKWTVRFSQVPTAMGFYVYCRDFTGDVFVRNLKMEEGDIATGWSLAPEDTIKQVRFWAGATFDERESAPFIVYNDGSMISTQGTFSGVFTGDIKIGNISIVDTSATSGNDAIVTIQNGATGVKQVQLSDKGESLFAQNLSVTDSSYNKTVRLLNDGTILASRGITLGTEATSVTINSSSVNINGSLLANDSSGLVLTAKSVSIGSASNRIPFIATGSATVQGELSVSGGINFNNLIRLAMTTNGMDINYI